MLPLHLRPTAAFLMAGIAELLSIEVGALVLSVIAIALSAYAVVSVVTLIRSLEPPLTKQEAEVAELVRQADFLTADLPPSAADGS